jgi:hypothetical protein
LTPDELSTKLVSQDLLTKDLTLIPDGAPNVKVGAAAT